VDSAPLTIVIGAGISGLTCAFALKQSGQKVLLLEATERPGGVIQTAEENGYLFELGPQSFNATTELAELCDDLGITEQLLEAPRAAPRYVLVAGVLKQVPFSPGSFIGSDLLSWSSKYSLLKDMVSTTTPPEPDESVAAFVRRKFSAELLDRLVGPFVSGIYAGDPEMLSLRAAFPKLYEAEKSAGSLIRGRLRAGAKAGKQTVTRARARPGLVSFGPGNGMLIVALAKELGSVLRHKVDVIAIQRTGDQFKIGIRNGRDCEVLTCDQLVLATPTTASSQMLAEMIPEASQVLAQIPYAPAAIVSLGYKQEQVGRSLNGFGFLAPRSSGLRTLGSVWNSSLFPSRAPKGHMLLSNFVGGATDPAAIALTEQELTDLVHREISPILNIAGSPVIARVTRYSRAIPQYNLGHLERLQKIRAAVASVSGLWLIGNYWAGPAVGACVQQAMAVAKQLRMG
jgi:oxygen-dependent protoporphyrinogen oxidase